MFFYFSALRSRMSSSVNKTFTSSGAWNNTKRLNDIRRKNENSSWIQRRYVCLFTRGFVSRLCICRHKVVKKLSKLASSPDYIIYIPIKVFNPVWFSNKPSLAGKTWNILTKITSNFDVSGHVEFLSGPEPNGSFNRNFRTKLFQSYILLTLFLRLLILSFAIHVNAWVSCFNYYYNIIICSVNAQPLVLRRF